MIPGKSKYEKASNEILAKQNEIVSMMEPYINRPEAIAAMKAVDAVTGEPIDAMGVYRQYPNGSVAKVILLFKA